MDGIAIRSDQDSWFVRPGTRGTFQHIVTPPSRIVLREKWIQGGLQIQRRVIAARNRNVAVVCGRGRPRARQCVRIGSRSRRDTEIDGRVPGVPGHAEERKFPAPDGFDRNKRPRIEGRSHPVWCQNRNGAIREQIQAVVSVKGLRNGAGFRGFGRLRLSP